MNFTKSQKNNVFGEKLRQNKLSGHCVEYLGIFSSFLKELRFQDGRHHIIKILISAFWS